MQNGNNSDVCIVGAGVAGGVMAAYLADNGVKVTVIEKSFTLPERIVGELLQPGGAIKLKEMGLDFLLNGIDAQPISGYGIFLNGENFPIEYPKYNNEEVTGFGFHNHRFLKQVRNYLLTHENVTLLEGTVTNFTEENGSVTGVEYEPRNGNGKESVKAALTVFCDGMFSAFREKLAVNEKRVSSYFAGYILHDCQLPFPGHGHVIVAKPSPCLIYPISSTETRILIDFPQQEAPRKSQELNDYLLTQILPQLPESVISSFRSAVEEGKLKVMPNHYIPAKPVKKDGAVLIGDSLNMRHPLTGGGMTAAFTDVKFLSDLIIPLIKNAAGSECNAAVESFYKKRHLQNSSINILADALYGVMRNDDLKSACFNYLKRGGTFATEPISLLSAISRDRNLLLRHFFAVALYGIKDVTRSKGANRFKRSHQMLEDAVDIVSPLVRNENPGVIVDYAFKIAEAVI